MYKSDIVICGNGRMVYEATVLDKYVISIPQNSREATHTFCRDFPGHRLLPIYSEVSAQTICDAIKETISKRQQFNEAPNFSIIRDSRKKIIFDIMNASSRTVSVFTR